MKKSTIPQEIKEEISKRIERFNETKLSHLRDEVEYFTEYKGKYLYLKRKEYHKISPVARLT